MNQPTAVPEACCSGPCFLLYECTPGLPPPSPSLPPVCSRGALCCLSHCISLLAWNCLFLGHLRHGTDFIIKKWVGELLTYLLINLPTKTEVCISLVYHWECLKPVRKEDVLSFFLLTTRPNQLTCFVSPFNTGAGMCCVGKSK